jgi:hypothetical protein
MIKGGLVIAVSLCLLSAAAQAETVNAFNGVQGGSQCWVYDTNGTTKLAIGCVVQLIQANGSVHPPAADGSTTGGDTLLASGTIYGDPGKFYLTATVTNGILVYVRAWNAASIIAGTYYKESSTHTVNATPLQPDDWYIGQDISTTRVIAVTTGITPTSRGQGAQSQVVTVEGQYFQSGATVLISGGNISYTTNFIDAQHYRLTNFKIGRAHV